jgi:hypothetical protein
MQFKRFVPQQLSNLLQGKQMSYSYGEFKEMLDPKIGKKVTVWEPQVVQGKIRMMFSFFTRGAMFAARGKQYFDTLSPREQQDLVSGIFTLIISSLGFMLTKAAFDDDEEEKWLAQSWLKIFKDLSEGLNPLDMVENFQYTSVSIAKLQKILKATIEFTGSVVSGEKNKYGDFKGETEFVKVTPIFSTIYDIDRALNNTKAGKNVGFDIFDADAYNWNMENIK